MLTLPLWLFCTTLDGSKNKKPEMWQHPTSDILARLRALGAFAYAKKQNDDLAQRRRQRKLKARKNDKKKKGHKKIRGDSSGAEGVSDSEDEESNKPDAAAVLCSKLGLQYVRYFIVAYDLADVSVCVCLTDNTLAVFGTSTTA